MEKRVKVIGGGLAGCECAFQLAERGIKVDLFEMKPIKFSPAHHNKNLCEIVCSNSFGGMELSTGAGLLKAEMKQLGSLIVSVAERNLVPAGGAMAVNRETFSAEIDKIIHSHPNINVINSEVSKINKDELTVVATGPLTSENLSDNLKEILGSDFLFFYDAAAPIVTAESIDFSSAFIADRYSLGNGDYVNCPMNKEEFEIFVKELLLAKTVPLKEFENVKVFEGCMPVEQMAKRGVDTLRFGPLKPVGLSDPRNNKSCYAVVQLRKENTEANLYNLVGFQTNLTFPEQKRVFGLIPALKNAEFVKYGVMHRNTYLNAPTCLNEYFQLKSNNNIYIAGQLSGVEGYMESTASGLIVGINIANMLNKKPTICPPSSTMIGGLINYLTSSTPLNFQPMNANFGILKPIETTEKNKKEKKLLYAKEALKFYEENKSLWDI